LLTCCGSAINGPYALVTTAVSADLGTQSALLGRTRALATITSIIDGMGSLGAALGPLLTGLLVPYGWSVVFAMLITSDLLAMLMSIWIVVNSSRRQHRRTYYRLQSTIPI
ncbi:MFS transporter, OPA family, solute carrier family 37, member 1/2, partial [Schistosoma bovis]